MERSSFWEQYEAAELELEKRKALEALELKRQRAASIGPSQNAPTRCRTCGRVDGSVLLGICRAC